MVPETEREKITGRARAGHPVYVFEEAAMSEESERDYWQGRVHVQELVSWFSKPAGEVAYLGGRKVLGVTVPNQSADRWDVVVELPKYDNTPRALTYTYYRISPHILVQCVRADEEAAVQGGPERIAPGLEAEKFDYIIHQLQESEGWQADQVDHMINPLEYLEMMRRRADTWTYTQSEPVEPPEPEPPERDDPSRYEADPEDSLYDPYAGSGQIDAEDFGSSPYEGGDWGAEE